MTNETKRTKKTPIPWVTAQQRHGKDLLLLLVDNAAKLYSCYRQLDQLR